MLIIKEKISSQFGKKIDHYDEHAEMQTFSADSLVELVQKNLGVLENQMILEPGCGTGIFSRKLFKANPKNRFIFSDFSAAALKKCRGNFLAQQQFLPESSFVLWDAEEEGLFQNVDLIASNMMFQWLLQPFRTLEKWLDYLNHKGCIALAFLGDESFQAWKNICQKAFVCFTGNQLPKIFELESFLRKNKLTYLREVKTFCKSFSSPMNFFSSLKNSGTSTSLRSRQLSFMDFKKLSREWELKGDLLLNYQICFLLIFKTPCNREV